MAATCAGDWLTGRDLNVLPLIGREVVDCSLISAITLLETSKDDHLCGVLVDDGSVLVA